MALGVHAPLGFRIAPAKSTSAFQEAVTRIYGWTQLIGKITSDKAWMAGPFLTIAARVIVFQERPGGCPDFIPVAGSINGLLQNGEGGGPGAAVRNVVGLIDADTNYRRIRSERLPTNQEKKCRSELTVSELQNRIPKFFSCYSSVDPTRISFGLQERFYHPAGRLSVRRVRKGV